MEMILQHKIDRLAVTWQSATEQLRLTCSWKGDPCEKSARLPDSKKTIDMRSSDDLYLTLSIENKYQNCLFESFKHLYNFIRPAKTTN